MHFDQQCYELVLMDYQERLARGKQQQLLREAQDQSRRYKHPHKTLFPYLNWRVGEESGAFVGVIAKRRRAQ